MTKTYIVAPNFSLGIESLQLGDIIPNPLGPELRPINHRCRIPIDATDLYKVGIVKDFTSTRGALLNGRFGLMTTFLAAIGCPVGVDLGIFLERNSKDIVKASRLETHEFIVTDKYVKDALNNNDVRAYLKGWKCKPVYIISGLKIAKGASVETNQGVNLETNAGPSVSNRIIEMKPALQYIRNRTQKMTFSSGTPFVLAFRVRRITFVGGKATSNLSIKGASMLDGIGNKVDEVPTSELGNDLSPEDAELEAKDEEIAFTIKRDVGDEEIEWIITDGLYE